MKSMRDSVHHSFGPSNLQWVVLLLSIVFSPNPLTIFSPMSVCPVNLASWTCLFLTTGAVFPGHTWQSSLASKQSRPGNFLSIDQLEELTAVVGFRILLFYRARV